MRLYALPLALLFIAFTIPTIAQTSEAVAAGTTPPVTSAAVKDGADSPQVVYYKLYEQLVLNCSSLAADTYTWSKNNTELVDGRWELQDKNAVLYFKHALEDEWGSYSCKGNGATVAWDVRARGIARLPANSNVVEGQNVTMTCKVIGKPAERVTWTFSPDNVTWSEINPDAEGSRYTIRDSAVGVPGGVLELGEAARNDAGLYMCSPPLGVNATTTLRVKDMYAALWPFLGICLEVLILCAVILVYEKRRTKPEMDDSDADTHDQ